jgi:16S rRNA (cytidine1402-2'-O)-methyltransferase
MSKSSNTSVLGCLYLVPNTLGEEDRVTQSSRVIPPDALCQMASLKNWIVEDAKTARALLNAVNQITPLSHPLQSMQMNEWRGPQSKNKTGLKPHELLKPLIQGEDVGLMSEAGVPGVADPGAEIINMAHHLGARVKPLVGPSSILLGLMASGLNGQCFSFHGYLPVDVVERSKKIKQLEHRSKQNHETQLWIETPYRNTAMLETCLATLLPQTQLCLAIDLSLETEWIWTAPINEWQKRFTNQSSMNDVLKNRPAIFLMLA